MPAHIGISKKDFVLELFTAPREIYYRRDYPSDRLFEKKLRRQASGLICILICTRG